VLAEMIEHHVKEEEQRSEGLFSQAREAGLDMQALADQMRARREEALQELKAEPKRPAEPRTFSHLAETMEMLGETETGSPEVRESRRELR